VSYPNGFKQVAAWEVPTDGNAVPYTRMTQMEAKRGNYPKVKRYLDWKRMLVISSAPYVLKHYHPAPKEKVYVYVHIYFKDKRHGDPDNVYKGILDALYRQDKYVAGCVDFGYDRDNPRVLITILERDEEG
jgi:hypothetical protein